MPLGQLLRNGRHRYGQGPPSCCGWNQRRGSGQDGDGDGGRGTGLRLRNVQVEDVEAHVRMRCDPVMMAGLGGPLPREGIEDKVRRDAEGAAARAAAYVRGYPGPRECSGAVSCCARRGRRGETMNGSGRRPSLSAPTWTPARDVGAVARRVFAVGAAGVCPVPAQVR
jgi:hypothetical protein